jgi:hypothetical protein
MSKKISLNMGWIQMVLPSSQEWVRVQIQILIYSPCQRSEFISPLPLKIDP